MNLSRYPLDLDLLLVPFSLCLTLGYHAYIWRNSNSQNPVTSIAVTMKIRRAWLHDIFQDEQEKRMMLGVQSLRNVLMQSILTATIAIAINLVLAALANNTYKSSHLLHGTAFGSQAGAMVVLKYASSSLLLLSSFLCSSMAVGFIVEANFLVSSPGMEGHVETLLRRSWALAMVGSRVLYATIPFLLWLLGPLPLALSSVAAVWLFYNLDFPMGVRGC